MPRPPTGWATLYALAGVRWENTNMLISNYQPVPFSSTTNFVNTLTPSHYAKLLPSLNLLYDVSDEIKLRGAISQNLARPTYSALAQNGTASLNAASFTASESISNPNLKPREVHQLRPVGGILSGPGRDRLAGGVRQGDRKRDRHPVDHHPQFDGAGLRHRR